MDYSSEVARRFDSPFGAGEIDSHAPGIVVAGEAEDRALNVWVRFQVQVHDGAIRVRFRAYGCPHLIAGASWAAEQLEGRPLAALRALDVERARRELDVPAHKLGKLLRIEDALAVCAERILAMC